MYVSIQNNNKNKKVIQYFIKQVLNGYGIRNGETNKSSVEL